MAARWAFMVTVSESHEVVGDDLRSSRCFLHGIAWHQLGLRKQCHSNQLFISFSIYREVYPGVLQFREANARHISEEFFG